MTCPCCPAWTPDDDATGYGAETICPDCAAIGFVQLANGEIVNEREDAPQRTTTRDQYAAFLTEPRR